MVDLSIVTYSYVAVYQRVIMVYRSLSLSLSPLPSRRFSIGRGAMPQPNETMTNAIAHTKNIQKTKQTRSKEPFGFTTAILVHQMGLSESRVPSSSML
jgi:hypothetical protein